MANAQPNDIIQLVSNDRKKQAFIVRLTPGHTTHTHLGIFKHDDLIGQPLGGEVFTHKNQPFLMLIPSTDDIIRHTKRISQIIYGKDLGVILMKMGVHAGRTVLEAGTGSGGMTTALALAVGPTGRVLSYDVRADMQATARDNLRALGLADRVTFVNRDIAEGFDHADVDALFLDVPNPWDYMAQAHAALKGGGFFGSLIPTTNQVSDLLKAMQAVSFGFVEVCEVLVRNYKPVPARLRPNDRMVAHTGFLVFARALLAPERGLKPYIDYTTADEAGEPVDEPMGETVL